jgi:hypothetical protein
MIFVPQRKHSYLTVTGIALIFIYVHDVRTSQESRLCATTEFHVNSFTFLYVDNVRTAQETRPRAATASYRDNFHFILLTKSSEAKQFIAALRKRTRRLRKWLPHVSENIKQLCNKILKWRRWGPIGQAFNKNVTFTVLGIIRSSFDAQFASRLPRKRPFQQA